MTTFDLTGFGGRTLHPHVQGVGPSKKDRERVIHYTQKDKLYIASTHLINFDSEANDKGWAVEMNNAPSVRAGMLTLQEKYPQTYYMYGERVEQGLKRRLGKSAIVRYSLSDFSCPPLDLTKAVVLFGNANIGKTQFALAHFKYSLLVTRMDDLKKISLRTDGIVFDQMCFTHSDTKKLNLTADETINLLDMELERSSPARYGDASIPAGMPRVFTTNRKANSGEPIFPKGCNAAEQDGIDRRVAWVGWLFDDLRK